MQLGKLAALMQQQQPTARPTTVTKKLDFPFTSGEARQQQ
jgi:hypothetical protein